MAYNFYNTNYRKIIDKYVNSDDRVNLVIGGGWFSSYINRSGYEGTINRLNVQKDIDIFIFADIDYYLYMWSDAHII